MCWQFSPVTNGCFFMVWLLCWSLFQVWLCYCFSCVFDLFWLVESSKGKLNTFIYTLILTCTLEAPTRDHHEVTVFRARSWKPLTYHYKWALRRPFTHLVWRALRKLWRHSLDSNFKPYQQSHYSYHLLLKYPSSYYFIDCFWSRIKDPLFLTETLLVWRSWNVLPYQYLLGPRSWQLGVL